jgi:tetratricopeptide (TPR) repeat protein
MRPIIIPLLAGLALLPAASLMSYRLAEEHLIKPYDVLHVPSSGAARIAALGHRTLVSDLYWLESVQYIGDPKAERRGWDRLFPLLDLVTDLDPRHGYAYQTGGIVLSAAGLLDESDAILQKGLEHGPPFWTFPYYLAFNAWFYRGDYPRAAAYAEIAAKRPGASPNISHLAVSLASKSGSPEQAITLLEELKATGTDEQTERRLDEQLKLAVLERDAQALERSATHFREQRGRSIEQLAELVASGTIRAIPPDPFGGTYIWDPSEGKVHSSVNPFRFTLHERPRTPRFQYRPPGSQTSGAGIGVLR